MSTAIKYNGIRRDFVNDIEICLKNPDKITNLAIKYKLNKIALEKDFVSFKRKAKKDYDGAILLLARSIYMRYIHQFNDSYNYYFDGKRVKLSKLIGNERVTQARVKLDKSGKAIIELLANLPVEQFAFLSNLTKLAFGNLSSEVRKVKK